jgi:hypothetical protein
LLLLSCSVLEEVQYLSIAKSSSSPILLIVSMFDLVRFQKLIALNIPFLSKPVHHSLLLELVSQALAQTHSSLAAPLPSVISLTPSAESSAASTSDISSFQFLLKVNDPIDSLGRLNELSLPSESKSISKDGALSRNSVGSDQTSPSLGSSQTYDFRICKRKFSVTSSPSAELF